MANSIGEALEYELNGMKRDALVQDYLMLKGGLPWTMTQELREEAAAWADRMLAEGKADRWFEATMPEPCPTCGHRVGD